MVARLWSDWKSPEEKVERALLTNSEGFRDVVHRKQL